MARCLLGAAGEDRRNGLFGAELGGEIFGKPAREVETGLLRDVGALDQFGSGGPANFDAAEEIGLGTRHLEEALRLERQTSLENLRVRLEANARATPVVDLAEVLEFPGGDAARESLPVEPPPERDFDFQHLG